MYRKILNVIALASIIFASSSAQAQVNSSRVEAVGNGWFVWATWGSMGINNCHIQKTSSNGTKLEFMFSLSNAGLDLKLNNENWRSLANGDIHRVSAQFGPDDILVVLDMESINVTSLFRGLTHRFEGRSFTSFLDAAASQDHLTFNLQRGSNQSTLATFDMTGVNDAIASLNNCVRIRQEEARALREADPFSGSVSDTPGQQLGILGNIAVEGAGNEDTSAEPSWTQAQRGLIARWEAEMVSCDPASDDFDEIEAACARLDSVEQEMRSSGICTQPLPDSGAVALVRCGTTGLGSVAPVESDGPIKLWERRSGSWNAVAYDSFCRLEQIGRNRSGQAISFSFSPSWMSDSITLYDTDDAVHIIPKSRVSAIVIDDVSLGAQAEGYEPLRSLRINDWRFRHAIKVGNSLRLLIEGRQRGTFSLAGTGQALDLLEQCFQRIG
ncbi:hypothetical protein [Erythrobacter litoralis]|uniref:hypothetical protein n=1 Tax=Erythrobacter litoralis TaxID=39960 RepID=UPI0012DE9E49|nr:hypothetical protein [Erythrobacter litoralis]